MAFEFLDEVFKRLIEDKEIKFYLKSRPNKIIPFPLIFKRMGILWHFSKDDSIKVLKELENRKMIKIVNFHGLKLLKFTN